MSDRKVLATFIFFLTAMVMGCFLRLYFVYPVSFINFKHLLHAHSHVILLGWCFNALYLSINSVYFSSASLAGVLYEGAPKQKRLDVLFWFIQGTIFLSMLGFLADGYALVSIVFSTAFLLGTFLWTTWIWPDVKKDKTIGGRFILLALLSLFVSSLGPLSLGVIMNTSLKSTSMFPLSIYFYLHFLYNGFFILGLIGLGFKFLDQKKIKYSQKNALKFYQAMKFSTVPLYALSAVWLNYSTWINFVGILAALVQMGGAFYLFKILKGLEPGLKPEEEGLGSKDVLQAFFFKIVVLVFAIKLVVQTLSGVQWIADIAFEQKSFIIIGYIHLIMLGLISIFILWYFLVQKVISAERALSRVGLLMFVLGVFLSEAVLFTQGLMGAFGWAGLSFYYGGLLAASLLIPLGILMLVLGQNMDEQKKF